MTVPDDERASPSGANVTALDIGANTLVACATTTGRQYLYAGRDSFEQFRATTRAIADAQAKLPEGQHSSTRIKRLYRTRTRRRNHAQDALVRDLVERLHDQGVATIIVGDVTGVLDTHWSVTVNEKTPAFWAFRRFRTRLDTVAEEYGIDVYVRSEAWTSQRCPRCGRTDTTTRSRDRLTCACGFVGYADLTAARTFRASQTEHIARPMARPVRFQWDDHEWYPIGATTGRSNELRTNPYAAAVPVSGSSGGPPSPAGGGQFVRTGRSTIDSWEMGGFSWCGDAQPPEPLRAARSRVPSRVSGRRRLSVAKCSRTASRAALSLGARGGSRTA